MPTSVKYAPGLKGEAKFSNVNCPSEPMTAGGSRRFEPVVDLIIKNESADPVSAKLTLSIGRISQVLKEKSEDATIPIGEFKLKLSLDYSLPLVPGFETIKIQIKAMVISSGEIILQDATACDFVVE